MNTELLTNIEKSTEALLRQQERLKQICTELNEEKETLLAKNQAASQHIHQILKELRRITNLQS